ncbi:unnamed protein product [Adineta steineri]|uniref:RRM domain-containing protein n=1 Tax=Adineta steineri TaxID=433720 RepID=A0A815QTM1_9BILA|nr:unnamed protein product [Adineta steineri]
MSIRKRQKRIENKIIITQFEQFHDELILKCFDYLDFNCLYDIFYNLNQRFRRLIESKRKIQINFNSIPSNNFLRFCFQINQYIKRDENYSLSILTDNKCRLNLILEDDLFKEISLKLKSLSLSNIDAETINSLIFNKTLKLYKRLERLNLFKKISEKHEGSNDIECKSLCNNLLSSKMKSLKYLRLNFEPYWCGCESGWNARPHYFDLLVKNASLSNLETLIIGNINDETTTKISFKTLHEKSLPCLTKLKNLMINAIHFHENKYSRQNQIYIPPLDLKFIKIWLDLDKYKPDDAKIIRKFIRDFFINNNSSDNTTIKLPIDSISTENNDNDTPNEATSNSDLSSDPQVPPKVSSPLIKTIGQKTNDTPTPNSNVIDNAPTPNSDDIANPQKSNRNAIFIRNLPLNMAENQLFDAVYSVFSTVGQIKMDDETKKLSIYLLKRKTDMSLNGNAIVMYENEEAVTEAIRTYNETRVPILKNAKVCVAEPKEKATGRLSRSSLSPSTFPRIMWPSGKQL